MLVIDAALIVLAAAAWAWRAKDQKIRVSWFMIILTFLALAGGFKGYVQIWRHVRTGYLRTETVKLIEKGDTKLDELISLGKRGEVRLLEHDQWVETYRTGVMRLFEKELPNSKLAQVVGTVPKEYSHEFRIEWVRQRLSAIIQNLRQALAQIHEHV